MALLIPEGLQHNRQINTALPYITNRSIVREDPCLVNGQNIHTTIRGTLERRPGFPTFTSDNFGANNIILRYFSWQRWNGSYFVMANVIDTNLNTSKVYKLQVGTDTTFQLLFTSSSTNNPFFFVVSNNFAFFGNGQDMKKYDGTTVTSWGVAVITTAPTLTNAGSGNVPGAIGHTYVFAGGNSTTGYLTDISNPSSSTNAANRQWTVSGNAYTDGYIDKIHIYRTQDGGSIWREVSGSPIANPGSGTWSFTDNTADSTLSSTQSPLAGINAAVTASFPCDQLYASRVFTWVNDTLYWSALEEANNEAMFVEAFPVNNKRRFGRQIQRVTVVGGMLLIYTVSGIFSLQGTSLATFQWGTLSRKHGLPNSQALDSDGSLGLWLDISNRILGTDGFNVTDPDISLPIRPDISGITQSSASVAIHRFGKKNYLILGDGGASALRVYNLDTKIWMPPWNIANTAVGSVQTAQGTWKLLIGSSALPLAMDDSNSVFQDNGTPFTAFAVTSLLPVVNPASPSDTGVIYYIITERDSASGFQYVQYLLDDDPAQGTYVHVDSGTITTNPRNPPNRVNTPGTYLIEEWWATTLQTAAKRVSMRFDWAAANSNFTLYSFDPAYTRFTAP